MTLKLAARDSRGGSCTHGGRQSLRKAAFALLWVAFLAPWGCPVEEVRAEDATETSTTRPTQPKDGSVFTGPYGPPETQPSEDLNEPGAEPEPTWLDEVLITATRSETKAFVSPYTINAVNVNGFSNNQLYRTTTDALRDVPGVMLQKTSNAQTSPFIRGFTGYRTLMLVDGIRLNNSTFRDGPNQYWNLIDPYTIDRLEVVKGPSSVLYGSDAIGGTVNAVLRRPDGYGEGLQGYRQLMGYVASAQRAYVGRGEAVATYGPWLGVLIGGTYKDFGDVDGGEDVGVQKKTGYGVCSGDVKIEYHPDPTTTWTFAHYQLYEDDAWRTHKTIYGTSWHGTTVGNEYGRVIDESRSLSYIRYRKDKVSECFDSIELTGSFQTLSEVQWRTKSSGQVDRTGTDVFTYGLGMQFVTPSKIGKWTYGAEWYHDEVSSFGRSLNADGSLKSVGHPGPRRRRCVVRPAGPLRPGRDPALRAGGPDAGRAVHLRPRRGRQSPRPGHRRPHQPVG